MSKALATLVVDSGNVRVITDGSGAQWYSAKDVCKAIGHKNPCKAIQDHVDEDMVMDMDVKDQLGRTHKSKFFNKKGLIVFLAKSRLAGRRFLDILVSQSFDLEEVLKAIRDFEVPEDLPEMYVYAIRESETGRIKLGISRNPESRLKQLQTGNSQELTLIAYRIADNRFSDERAIHKENSDRKIRGEWFSPEVSL